MTEPHYADDAVTLYHGDCLDILAELPDASVDAVVTDPPYGLEFMGKDWDKFGDVVDDPASVGGFQDGAGGNPYSRSRIRYGVNGNGFQAWCELWAAECLRVLKPGGHMLAFGGTRTWHRLASAIEDAGFEIRDSIAWLYGSGFPKSLDVSKAIDKRRDWLLVERLAGEIRRARAAAGLSLAEIGQAAQDATGGTYGKWYHRGGHMFFETGRSLPSRPEWEQLRRVLPIAQEFVAVYDEAEREVIGTQEGAMSGWSMDGETRFVDRPITAPATADAQTWAGWGTALKPAHEPIVVARKPLTGTVAANVLTYGTGALNVDGCRIGGEGGTRAVNFVKKDDGRLARWDEGHRGARNEIENLNAGRWPANVVLDPAAAEELDKQSGVESTRPAKAALDGSGSGSGNPASGVPFVGGIASVGYVDFGGASRFFYVAKAGSNERPRNDQTAHPTVKPLDLMRWLVRLVTPPGGIVLEPFAGSGTTAEACVIEGFRCIAVEREADYLPLIVQRLSKPIEPVMF